MSDEPTGEGRPGEAEETASAGDGAAEDVPGGRLSDADAWRYLRLGAIGLLSLLVLVSTVQLYTNASAAIGRWVAPDYAPLFRVAFNLAVLLLALAGLAVVARRRQSTGSE